MWTDKETDKFVKWYLDTYKEFCEEGEDGRLELPIIHSDNPQETRQAHEEMWKAKLTEIIGPRKSKRIYKDRGNYQQTWLDYVFSWLWLGYGPVFK